MGADLNNIVKCQKLTDDHVQFLIYQILRGLKVSETPCTTLVPQCTYFLFVWIFKILHAILCHLVRCRNILEM